MTTVMAKSTKPGLLPLAKPVLLVQVLVNAQGHKSAMPLVRERNARSKLHHLSPRFVITAQTTTATAKPTKDAQHPVVQMVPPALATQDHPAPQAKVSAKTGHKPAQVATGEPVPAKSSHKPRPATAKTMTVMAKSMTTSNAVAAQLVEQVPKLVWQENGKRAPLLNPKPKLAETTRTTTAMAKPTKDV
jgi:hypothetical protein